VVQDDDAQVLALAISLNVQHRDLTAAQRAMVAAKAWGLNGSSKGGRPEKRSHCATVSEGGLPDGVDKHQSSRFQRLASLPESVFRDYLRGAREAGAYETMKRRQTDADKRRRDLAAPGRAIGRPGEKGPPRDRLRQRDDSTQAALDAAELRLWA